MYLNEFVVLVVLDWLSVLVVLCCLCCGGYVVLDVLCWLCCVGCAVGARRATRRATRKATRKTTSVSVSVEDPEKHHVSMHFKEGRQQTQHSMPPSIANAHQHHPTSSYIANIKMTLWSYNGLIEY